MIRFLIIATCLTIAGLPAPVVATDEGQVEKVVYHLDNSGNARWAILLANAHLEQNAKANIVIVAHGPGIRFLIKGAQDGKGSPYEPDVFALANRGVEFLVCAATLKVMDIPEDEVLDDARLVPSGAYEIVRLQTHEDYAYLKP